MERKQSSKWNEIRSICYTAAIVLGALGTNILAASQDTFSLVKGAVCVVVAFGAILLARYVVPPEENDAGKTEGKEEPKEKVQV